MNALEQLKRIKATERQQLLSGEPPTMTQFWTQPHGVRLLLMKGDVLGKVSWVVQTRGLAVSQQRIGRMTAYPAHVGTLLSRRRRGCWSGMLAAWFSSGWTKVQETTAGGISTDEEQISIIAKRLAVATVGVHHDQYIGNVGLIEVSADGLIRGHTYMTLVLTEPQGNKWHPAIAADPTPTGLTNTLLSIGFDVQAHMLAKTEMLTINNIYQ
jgi:hypothetical protein